MIPYRSGDRMECLKAGPYFFTPWMEQVGGPTSSTWNLYPGEWRTAGGARWKTAQVIKWGQKYSLPLSGVFFTPRLLREHPLVSPSSISADGAQYRKANTHYTARVKAALAKVSSEEKAE